MSKALNMLAWLAAALACAGVVGTTNGCAGEHCHDADCHSDDQAGATGMLPGTGGTGGTGAKPLADVLCDCLLTSCHDAYHATYGGPSGDTTVEKMARDRCKAEAATLPTAGMSVTQGNYVECRIHHCEKGKTDLAACPGAVGMGACL